MLKITEIQVHDDHDQLSWISCHHYQLHSAAEAAAALSHVVHK